MGAVGWVGFMTAVAGCAACSKAAPVDPDEGLKGGALVFEDRFEGEALSGDWAGGGGGLWSIVGGEVRTQRARNEALWLKRPMPDRVRVEFDVRSDSDDGDIKVEIFGDGERHQSGYILIFGGWKNRINTIARLDEHGADRQQGAEGVRVERGRVYKMAVVRTDHRVRWYLDRDKGERLLVFEDKAPLVGDGHRHFGFNDWEVPLFFDNVRVFDLGGR